MKVLNIKWSAKRVLIALGLGLFVWMLYVQGSEQRRAESGADPASDTATCRVASTVADLNVRSAPVENPTNVVDQLAKDEQVDADRVVQDGFRKLTDGRWVSAELVRVVEGADCG
jgi:hypothetical protein